MSLADERRAIAQGMAASRAATGADERRAIGQRLVNERRGIKEDLNALEKSPRKNAQLPQLERRGTRGPAVGVGSWNPNRVPAPGGGIASPLVEQPGTREYYTAVLRPSTDGAVFFSVRATKTIVMTDANGAEVVMEFQNVTS